MSEFDPPADNSAPRTGGHDLFAPETSKEQTAPPRRIEDLPAVEPPSAGFIVQLFLIPLLIVGAIVGVYALFGRMASGEQDWRTLVTELRNSNEHRRWRAAIGLAQLLKVDQDRGEAGQHLSENPEIAKALLDVLEEQRTANLSREKALNQQQYLVTALGLLDQPKLVIPPLQKLMLAKNDKDRGVRLEALRSISLIAQRTKERSEKEHRPLLMEELVAIPSLVEDVATVSQESEPVFRQMGAFVLGLLPSAESRERLEVMLSDSDREVQVDAAIGLARQSSTAGWPVFQDVLKQAANRPAEQKGMDLVSLKNTLKAVGTLKSEWTGEQKKELTDLIGRLAKHHPEVRIRTDAAQTLQMLKNAA